MSLFESIKKGLNEAIQIEDETSLELVENIKIGFVSDLHVDVNAKFSVTEMLLKFCIELNLDYLIVAGDIGQLSEILIFLDIFKYESKTQVKFIPGNHDIWINKDMQSNEIYEILCKREECLVDNPPQISDFIVLGDSMHYDYTFKIDRFSIEEQKRKRYRGQTWMDKKYLKWINFSDQELNDFFLDRLQNQLEKFKGKRVICVTHTVPFKAFIKYTNELEHDYFSAFIGSNKIGQLLLHYPNVEMSVFGHTHYRNQIQLEHIEAICPALGYYFEWESDNVYEELRNVVKVVEI